MDFIYGDLRDLRIFKVKDYSLNKAMILDDNKYTDRKIYFYNSLGNSIISKNTTILYVKFSYVIKNKDASVFECYNLKRNQTICFSFKKPISSEKEELYITFITENGQVFNKKLTTLYLESNKIKTRSYDHFYFKAGRVNKISIYPFINYYIIIIYILVIIICFYIIVSICF